MRETKPERRADPPISASLERTLRASDDLLEVLPVATFICDPAGRIVQYNRRAAEIWGRPPLPGETHERFTAACKFFDADGRILPQSKLAEVLHTGRAVRDEEVMVERPDGSRVALLITIDPLSDPQGRLAGVVSCFQDITERKRMFEALERSQRDLRQQEQRWNATYEHAAIGIVEIDADGRFLRINESICGITGLSREELLGWRLFASTHPDDRDIDEEMYRRQVAGEIGFYSIEKRFVRKDGRVIWIAVRSSTVRDHDGNFLYGVRVVQDVTEHKESQQRQKLLVDELNHRVKNTLATVQSLAAQTAIGADSPDAFRHAFEGRLIALSHAHDQLTRRHWKSADLLDIVGSATAPYLAQSQDRVVIDGDIVTVAPRAALSLAMIFHELATNSAKYGALSSPAGRIELTWRRVHTEARPPGLHLEWREIGGPPVEQPTRRGFGSRFIEGSASVELRGRASLVFDAAGLRCLIDIPLDRNVVDAAADTSSH